MMPIAEFAVALAGFLILHIVPARSEIRAGLVTRMGLRGYLSIYALVSLGLLGWLLSAAVRAPQITLWTQQSWHTGLAVAIMPFAFIFVVTGLASANPLSINLTGRSFDACRPGIVAVTRHPVLWGFALWAGAHGLANGHLVAAVLFGGLGLFALAGMATLDKKAAARLGAEQWRKLSNPTSIVPLAAIIAGRVRFPRDRRTAWLVVIALALFAAFLTYGHALLFGLAPLDRL